MSVQAENDKAMKKAFHDEYKNNKDMQKAVRDYTSKHGLLLPSGVRYAPGIDCVGVFIDDKPIFIIGLPPVSNYSIDETEYTNTYLRPNLPIAV